MPRKRVAYCRCWKSKKFPYCDGTHTQHNQSQGDRVGPLVMCWLDEPAKSEEEEEVLEIPSPVTDPGSDQDMDIKSIDSESPILQSGGDSNGEFEQVSKPDAAMAPNTSSDEQLSSMEMIEGNDSDEDAVKVVPASQS